MRSDFIDLSGKTFGRWTVISFAGKNRHGQNMWLCRCSCGTEKIVRGGGKIFSKSCGCLQREKASSMIAGVNRKHGDYRKPLYRIWAAMKRRCNNKNSPEYKNYGGRGIKICPEWNHYEGFKEWAHRSGYKDGLTLDRINVDGDYEPANCRWVPIRDQQRNRRDNIWIEVGGEKVLLADLARQTGILDKTLYSRYKKGARTVEELTRDVGKRIYVDYEGRRITLRKLAEIHGLKYGTVWKRYKRGKRSIEDLTKRVN